MAERRMFAKSIVLSDAFLDMPATARCLYFSLGMLADDDGFIGNPKSIIRQIGASEDDIKILLSKRYLLSFESGIIVIKHWRLNNYIQNDRHHKTTYIEEMEELTVDEKGSYTEKDKKKQMYTDACIQSVYIDKDSIDKYSIDNNIKVGKRTNFKPPTLREVEDYCKERGNNVNPQRFIDFYESKGWMVGKNKMKDWKACVRTWEQIDNKNNNKNSKTPNPKYADRSEYNAIVLQELSKMASTKTDIKDTS